MRPILIYCLLVTVGCQSRQASPLPPSDALTNSLQNIVQQHQLMGMAVLVLAGGEMVYQKGFGYANLELQTPVTPDTKFRIASISKLVTTIAIMQLAEQELVDLDRDVSTYLDWELKHPVFPGLPITLRQLLSHRSGIRDGTGYGRFIEDMHTSRLDIKELFLESGAYYSGDMYQTAPGSYFNYCNAAWGIIASVIEKVTGQTFDYYCRQNIFKPLALTSSYNVQDLNLTQLATLYRFKDGHWEAQVDNYRKNPPAPLMYERYKPGKNGIIYAPQGGARCSVNDLGVLAKTLLNDGVWETHRLLKKSSIETMTSPQWQFDGKNGNTANGFFQAYGLGTHILTAKDSTDVIFPGRTLVGHPGEAYGLISDIYLEPATGTGLIFITNGSRSEYLPASGSAFYQVEQEVFQKCFLYLKDSKLYPNYP